MREPTSGGNAQSIDGRVRDVNDMGRDVFLPRRDRGIKAYAYNEGSGTKLEFERVNGVFELPVELIPYERSTSKSSNTKAYSSLSAIEQIGSLMHKIASAEHPKSGHATL